MANSKSNTVVSGGVKIPGWAGIWKDICLRLENLTQLCGKNAEAETYEVEVLRLDSLEEETPASQCKACRERCGNRANRCNILPSRCGVCVNGPTEVDEDNMN